MTRSAKKIALVAATLTAMTGTSAFAANQGLLPEGAPAKMAVTIEGPVMVNSAGMTLYYNTAENMRSPRFAWQCTSVSPRTTNDAQSGIGERPQIGFKLIKSCLDKFKPYTPDAGAKPIGDFTIVDRPDGARQWAYKSMPLWLSLKDRRPGEMNSAGRNFGGGGRGGGLQVATIPMEIPTGLKFSRRAEGFVLVTKSDERAVYTPRAGARMMKVGGNGREDFKPISAPAIATVSGDWSIVDDGSGQKQYAFKGKPLYAAPVSLNELEVANVRAWEPVVLVKAPIVPAAIGTHLTLNGDVYTTSKGITLYTYNCTAGGRGGGVAGVTCDDPGDPAAFMVALCGDGKECARRWHPYVAAPNAKAEGEFSLLDITYPMFTDMRGPLYPADAPHVKAWAYRGKPLFTYYEDEKPGDMWGNNIGGIWGSTWGTADVPGKSSTFFEP